MKQIRSLGFSNRQSHLNSFVEEVEKLNGPGSGSSEDISERVRVKCG